MCAVNRDVGASGKEALEIVLGGEIGDHRHTALVADPREGLERDLAVLHGVVRDDVECGSCALRDFGAQLVIARIRDITNRHDLGAGKPDALLNSSP